MTKKTPGKKLPIELQRELVDVALLHLHLDGSWEGKDLGGETHQLSELARRYLVELLEQLLAGKRPYLPTPAINHRPPANERYVALIKGALASGVQSMAEAYRFAASGGKAFDSSKHDARLREAKRAWQAHWQELASAMGPGHSIRPVPPVAMRDWTTQARLEPSKVDRQK